MRRIVQSCDKNDNEKFFQTSVNQQQKGEEKIRIIHLSIEIGQNSLFQATDNPGVILFPLPPWLISNNNGKK